MPKLTRPQAQLAKNNPLAWLTILLVLCLCAFHPSAQAAPASIAITSPAAGATPTLNCVVTVIMPATFGTGQSYAGPAHLEATDNTGNTTKTSVSTQTMAHWDTTQSANGSVTLIAFLYYHDADGSWQTVQSPPIVVAVKNGFDLNTDVAKTYAKVTQPTAGQSITANGANFSITSDHQITWTRYDNCGSYRPYYKFRRMTTYPNVADVVVSGNYTLPMQTNDCPYQRTLGDVGYVSGGPTPVVYIVYAFCYTPDESTQVATGNSNFTMTPVK